MIERLKAFIECRAKEINILRSYSEAQTSQALVLPILYNLGWDIYNPVEVFPEYTTENKRVDFALQIDDAPKVFVEVKKCGANLREHQSQLIEYAQWSGVPIGILTNGLIWQIFLPMKAVHWQERLVCSLEIENSDPVAFTRKLIALLSKKQIISGEAMQSAETIFRSHRNLNLLKNNLPKAWNKIILESNEVLIRTLAETTKKLCQVMPDENTVRDFLQSNRDYILIPQMHIPSPKNGINPKTSVGRISKTSDGQRKKRDLQLEAALKQGLGNYLQKKWGSFQKKGQSQLIFTDSNKRVLCIYSSFKRDQTRWFWGVLQKNLRNWGSNDYLALILEDDKGDGYLFLMLDSTEAIYLFRKCSESKGNKKINMRIYSGGETRLQEWQDFSVKNRLQKLNIKIEGSE
ncbi:MAG: type I restriction enzyme HsdR N-terminal domain-containing protein [Candidatus Marinimicrobia bacterium]|nr:type I restriction enzyme HsdR N-terminal domain-containing protein [Candidatus Neomarinimicrobiota bacterium]